MKVNSAPSLQGAQSNVIHSLLNLVPISSICLPQYPNWTGGIMWNRCLPWRKKCATYWLGWNYWSNHEQCNWLRNDTPHLGRYSGSRGHNESRQNICIVNSIVPFQPSDWNDWWFSNWWSRSRTVRRIEPDGIIVYERAWTSAEVESNRWDSEWWARLEKVGLKTIEKEMSIFLCI